MTRPSRPRRGMPKIPRSESQAPLVVLEGSDGVGRSTQVDLLLPWIEANGRAVVSTGWNRSLLVSKLITSQKEGTLLNKVTYAMLYATDFADRLERVVIPALKSGVVVLADRYVPTAVARAVARGVDRTWIENLYSFAHAPDLTLYLRLDAEDLLLRNLHRGPLNYWESGMDQHMGEDIHDSFLRYQTRLLAEYESMAEAQGWRAVDARRTIEDVQLEIRRSIAPLLQIPPAALHDGLETPARPKAAQLP